MTQWPHTDLAHSRNAAQTMLDVRARASIGTPYGVGPAQNWVLACPAALLSPRNPPLLLVPRLDVKHTVSSLLESWLLDFPAEIQSSKPRIHSGTNVKWLFEIRAYQRYYECVAECADSPALF